MICVFARATSEPLTSLVKKIDDQIGENGKLKAFVVIMTKDADATSSALKTLAETSHVKHVPLTMIGEPNGPPDYELSKDADVTVLMWHKQKVVVNHAFKGELTAKDVDAVTADIPKILKD